MASRISFSQVSSRILDRLFMNYNKLEGTQEQLATGKKINNATDDPVSAAQSMELRSQLDQFSSFQRNINDGLGYLGTIDSTLNTGTNIYQAMRERAIQASNDSNSGDSRYYIGQEVRGMFDQMVALSNTTFKGEFVFSGTNTQVAPYEMRNGQSTIQAGAPANSSNSDYTAIGTWIDLKDQNVTDSNDTPSKSALPNLIVPGTFGIPGLKEGTDFEVNYHTGQLKILSAPAAASLAGGNLTASYSWLRRNEKDLDGVSKREIEEGVTARINTTASDAFGAKTGGNAWDAMIDLLDGTLNNKPDKIRGSLDGIDQSLKRNLTAQSSNGARVQRFESTQSRNSDRQTYTTQLQSDVEDVDFAKAVSDFNLEQAVYEASLKMGAQALQSSLVNFL
ncbi:MAG: flagellar hook-associated protein FlgL [Fibrobacteres bacterium]|nr:flagellar hook-associated protein FlgL [Fibrobacterota bacterium]